MNILKDLAYRHFELGYARQLLWLDSFFLVAAVGDGIVYSGALHLNLLTKELWLIHWSDLASAFTDIAMFTVFLLIVAPIVITFLRTIGWASVFLKGPFATSQRRIFAYHLSFCLLCLYLYLVSRHMQTLSGWALSKNGAYHFTFHSYYASLVGSPAFKLIFGSASTVVAAAGSALLSFVVLGRAPTASLNQYLVRASLADLSPDLRPARGSGRFDVPNPSTLTRIAFVAQYASDILKEYQRLGPGSEESGQYLDRCYSECIGTITEKLLRSPTAGISSAPVQTDLFTGTKRAFQAALSQAKGPRDIVVTPFGTPSLVGLLKWHSAVTGDPVHFIAFQPDDYFEVWETQQQKILADLSRYNLAAGRTMVLVISEVFYASGMRVPLRGFIRRVREMYPVDRIRILVDGTNAVGNRRIVALEPEWDNYVFSPHKWLMATESCGVVLSRVRTDPTELDAPGVWRVGSRKTDTQVRVLAGFRASMELVRRRGLEYFFVRCEELRRQFKLGLPRNIRTVGDQSGLEETYILSCCPVIRFTWKLDTMELGAQLFSRRLNASVLPLNPLLPWVRVTIPYFLDLREINRICDFLDEMSR